MSLYFSKCFFFVFLKARCLCISLDSHWARSSDQGFDDFPVKKLLYKISPQIGSKWSSAPEQQQNLNDNHSEYSFHSSQRFRLKWILSTQLTRLYLRNSGLWCLISCFSGCLWLPRCLVRWSLRWLPWWSPRWPLRWSPRWSPTCRPPAPLTKRRSRLWVSYSPRRFVVHLHWIGLVFLGVKTRSMFWNVQVETCSRTKREDLSLSMALLPTPWSVSVKARLPSDRGRYLCSDYVSNEGGDDGDGC